MKIKENSFNVGIKACLAFNTCSIFSSQASESVLIAEHINLYDWKFSAFIQYFKRYTTNKSLWYFVFMSILLSLYILHNHAGSFPNQNYKQFCSDREVTNCKLFWWLSSTIQSLIWQKSNCSHDHYQMFAEKTPITLLTYVTL